MKKIISILLLICTLTFCLASCGHSHSHSYSEWKNIKDPTCTTDGIRERTCSCGDVEQEILPKKHKWQDALCGEEQACELCEEKRANPYTQHYNAGGDYCIRCRVLVYNIIPPELPIIVNCYNYDNSIEETIKITEITWDPKNSCIKWAAERIYHEEGDEYSANARFGWKIYDSEGYVIDSGTEYSNGSIKVGEKTKNQEIKIFPSLYDWEKWENYTLEILNLK